MVNKRKKYPFQKNKIKCSIVSRYQEKILKGYERLITDQNEELHNVKKILHTWQSARFVKTETSQSTSVF